MSAVAVLLGGPEHGRVKALEVHRRQIGLQATGCYELLGPLAVAYGRTRVYRWSPVPQP